MNRSTKSNKGQNKGFSNIKFKHSTNKKILLANSLVNTKKRFRNTLKGNKDHWNPSVITKQLKSRVKQMKRASRIRNNTRTNNRDTSDEHLRAWNKPAESSIDDKSSHDTLSERRYNYKIIIKREQNNQNTTHQEQGWEGSNKQQIMWNEEEAKSFVYALDQKNTLSQSSDEDDIISNSNLLGNLNKNSNMVGLSVKEAKFENRIVSMKDIGNPNFDKSFEIEMSNNRAISPASPEHPKEKI